MRDLAEALHVGDAFEEEHALDQLLGMLHLADGVLADDLVEARRSPSSRTSRRGRNTG